MRYVLGITLFLIGLASIGLVATGAFTIKNNEQDIVSLSDMSPNTKDLKEESSVSCSTSSTSSVCIQKDSNERTGLPQTDSVVTENALPKTGTNNFKKYIEIVRPSGFVNSNNQPITIGEYVGKKVIVLNVMTYSCSNCQATFPYVNTWYEAYKDDGLIVIGLHTPEFAFEKDKDNVEEAMLKFGITYPVIMDNEYATWNAYGNRFWPRKYLIDIHGNIVYDHIGEGAYEETDAEIVKALVERKRVLGLE